MNENREILNRMAGLAREAWHAWQAAERAGLPSVAEIHHRRWDAAADACYSFAAREGLRVRKGQTTGKF